MPILRSPDSAANKSNQISTITANTAIQHRTKYRPHSHLADTPLSDSPHRQPDILAVNGLLRPITVSTPRVSTAWERHTEVITSCDRHTAAIP